MNIPVAAASIEDTQAKTLFFEFKGNAKEYFGIWIVNLFLTIITLGIYSAWATVRRRRYFYGNTSLDGHNFEYHAEPIQILIGRIIVFAVLIAISLLTQLVSPWFNLLYVPYLIALPLLINKSMAFNARMTSFRNVRLSFGGTYWGALGVFIGMPLLALLSFGILGPIASRLSANYIGRHLKFGNAAFRTDARLGLLYRNWGAAVGVVLAGAAGLAALSALAIWSGWDGVMTIVPVSVYAVLLVSFSFYAAGVRNIAFNSTELEGGVRLHSKVGRLRYVWILFSNLVAIILSLSLLSAWSSVRYWRYLSGATSLTVSGTLDHFVGARAAEGNVAAAEFMDIEGFDFGL